MTGSGKRRALLVLSSLLVLGGLFVAMGRVMAQDWRTASREPAGIAPDPETTHEAVIQAYAARAFNWRGIFSVHSWIAVKPTGAPSYTVYQVVGWRTFRGLPALSIAEDVPDRLWFGSRPQVIADLRGDGVDQIIEEVDRAARAYPFADRYRLWPGPNSNTFTAFVGREVPALGLDLPANAIGKDWLGAMRIVDRPPSGRGLQFSLLGVFGFIVAAEEGLEINIFGLNFGLDPLDPSVSLPFVGRLGPARPTAAGTTAPPGPAVIDAS